MLKEIWRGKVLSHVSLHTFCVAILEGRDGGGMERRREEEREGWKF